MPQRRSIRLKRYNYSQQGFYFVTICTHLKQPTLGQIVQSRTELSETGGIVQKCWAKLPTFFSGLILDAFVIMPNHIHGIIQLVEGNATDIGEIVRNFKSISARRVRTVTRRDSPVWQRNYFERIIRTDRELNLTRMYVKLNPRMWMSHLKLVDIDFKSEEDLAKLLEPYSHL